MLRNSIKNMDYKKSLNKSTRCSSVFLLEFARKAIQKGNMPFEYKSRNYASFPCVDKLTDCRETSEGLRSKYAPRPGI